MMKLCKWNNCQQILQVESDLPKFSLISTFVSNELANIEYIAGDCKV